MTEDRKVRHMERRLRVNSPNVMSETIEGEVIVINLATGSYYSLKDAGAAIWHALEHGAAPDEVTNVLEASYEGSRTELLEAVEALLADLEGEGLVTATEGQDGAAVEIGAQPEAADGNRRPFERPVLEKYTDMQELILLDPVHEVGAAGWPHLPAETADRA